MRAILIAASAAALVAADGASAQRMVQYGPSGSFPMAGTSYPAPSMAAQSGSRWGSNVNGRWWGGSNAPGGWSAYHRPYRGWVLPSYWIASRFFINDYATYGLGVPPQGYTWVRYYNDAVLIDDRGAVYDSVNALNWDGYASAPVYTPTLTYSQPGYAVQPSYAQPSYSPTYAQPNYAQSEGSYYQRNSGVGGAVAGAVVGGVAGNLIGGRGNRTAGTLIGAGVGGVAGYAVDSAGSHRVAAPQGYAPSAPYAPMVGYDQASRGPMRPMPVGGPGWVSPDGATTVRTVGGYAGSTTIITVQSAPVVTTTTTEIVEDAVTYTPRHRYRKHVWHRPRARCGCAR